MRMERRDRKKTGRDRQRDTIVNNRRRQEWKKQRRHREKQQNSR